MRNIFTRCKYHIRLTAVVIVFAALAGMFAGGGQAQENDNGYVDVGLTLEVPYFIPELPLKT